MMLRIDCPWCGPRDEIEFSCGGQSHIARPTPPEDVGAAEWARYLHERNNPCGDHLERWLHVAGCRRWFNLARDTLTHEIRSAYRMDQAAPVLADASAAR